MEIFFYIIIFIMGCYFGSFFTLAVYRIPKKENILYKHSYCPKCNHKLGMLDLIPILSYLLLGAKCRYCKSKIRPRYFLLEIFTGIIFLIFAISQNLYNSILIKKDIILPIIGFLYLSGLFITAGIDREKTSINESVMVYQSLIVFGYNLTLWINYNKDILIIAIHSIILILLYMVSRNIKANKKANYIINLVILIYLMYLYSNLIQTLITIILTMLLMGSEIILNNVLNKNKDDKTIGFYLCVANIITTIISNVLV